MGAKAFGTREQKRKAAVVLDTEQFRYQRYISDIAGQDIRAHGGNPAKAIRHVRNFLSSHTPQSVFLAGPDRIIERYERFRAELPISCAYLHMDPAQLTFVDLTRLIEAYISS